MRRKEYSLDTANMVTVVSHGHLWWGGVVEYVAKRQKVARSQRQGLGNLH